MITLTSPFAIHPRLADCAVPVARIAFSPAKVAGFGLREAQLTPVGADVLSVEVEVPPGEWLVWPSRRWAMWIGRRVDALPAVIRARLETDDGIDVASTLTELADAGVWLREAAVLNDGSWGPSRRSGDLLDSPGAAGAAALSGIFVDQLGRSGRLEIAPGGVWWTDRPTLAVNWLLGVLHLAAPQ